MNDNFDAVEIVYAAISSVGTVYKDKAPRDTSGTYVVVNSPSCAQRRFVNIPLVNVNIFVPKTSNGMVNRTSLKTIRTAVYSGVESADPEGYYCEIDRVFSALVEDVREGYDCFTIRFELTLNA